MKKIITLSVLFISGFTLAQAPLETVVESNPIAMKYAETITVEDLREDLTILASDALEGRETGKRGQKMAAAYIRAHFEELGLEGPAKSGNGYYQDVPLNTSKAGDIYLKIGDRKLPNLKEFIYYGDAQNTEEVTSEVVFVGSGSEKEFDAVDVKGKMVLYINPDRGERRKILQRAKDKGVYTALAVRSLDDDGFNSFLKRYGIYITRETISLDVKSTEQLSGTFYVSPTVAGEIFGNSFDDLTKAIEKFNAGNNKALNKIIPKKVTYKIDYNSEKIISENVLGYLEGSDLKDELLVITSHYDHLGVGEDGQIYNGADDDGSGTVAVMDIAEAFVKAKADGNGPRRSILFMTVTAEEKGLLGSEYYAENPVFPLKNTVADLNIDMIGRIDDRELENQEYVSLVGADKLSTELHEISENANKLYTNLFLDYTYNDPNHRERIYYRSDHWNFAKNGIPVIFYTTGSHPDYHKPTDIVENIEFDLMAKRTKLVFYTAWEIVNRDGRLIVDKEVDPNAIK